MIVIDTVRGGDLNTTVGGAPIDGAVNGVPVDELVDAVVDVVTVVAAKAVDEKIVVTVLGDGAVTMAIDEAIVTTEVGDLDENLDWSVNGAFFVDEACLRGVTGREAAGDFFRPGSLGLMAVFSAVEDFSAFNFFTTGFNEVEPSFLHFFSTEDGPGLSSTSDPDSDFDFFFWSHNNNLASLSFKVLAEKVQQYLQSLALYLG